MADKNIQYQIGANIEDAQAKFAALQNELKILKAAYQQAFQNNSKTTVFNGEITSAEKLHDKIIETSKAINNLNTNMVVGFSSYGQQLNNLNLKAQALHQQWIASGKTLEGYHPKMAEIQVDAKRIHEEMKSLPNILGQSDNYLGSLTQKFRKMLAA